MNADALEKLLCCTQTMLGQSCQQKNTTLNIKIVLPLVRSPRSIPVSPAWPKGRTSPLNTPAQSGLRAPPDAINGHRAAKEAQTTMDSKPIYRTKYTECAYCCTCHTKPVISVLDSTDRRHRYGCRSHHILCRSVLLSAVQVLLTQPRHQSLQSDASGGNVRHVFVTDAIIYPTSMPKVRATGALYACQSRKHSARARWPKTPIRCVSNQTRKQWPTGIDVG